MSNRYKPTPAEMSAGWERRRTKIEALEQANKDAHEEIIRLRGERDALGRQISVLLDRLAGSATSQTGEAA